MLEGWCHRLIIPVSNYDTPVKKLTSLSTMTHPANPKKIHICFGHSECIGSISHRIHGAAIYGNIYHQYTPVMLAYIPAPWIRHGIWWPFKWPLHFGIQREKWWHPWRWLARLSCGPWESSMDSRSRGALGCPGGSWDLAGDGIEKG